MQRDIKRWAPGPPWYQVPYRILRARSNPLDSIDKEFKQFGDIARLQIGSFNVYFLGHPDHIGHVLGKHSQIYSRLTVDYLTMKPVLGEGLITTDGPAWQRQRRMLQPEFHSQRINSFAKVTSEATKSKLNDWKSKSIHNTVFDISEEMASLTLRIVADALFSSDSRTFSSTFTEAAVLINRHVDQDATTLFEIPHSIPTPRNREFHKSLKILDDAVFKIINEHRENKEIDDLVSMMIKVRDPDTGMGLNDTEIRDQIMTFLMAGHETSSNALAWTLYLLAIYPEIADHVRLEVAKVLGDRIPTFDDIPKLKYIKRVLQESMRLYPPVWSVSRKAIATDELGGYFIPRDAYLYLSVYRAHRHPDYWIDADKFDPDRFLTERIELQHRYAYLPFGAGPHLCIGREFAMLSMQIVIAMLTQRYRFELVQGQQVVPEPLITLRPKYGIKMRVQEIYS